MARGECLRWLWDTMVAVIQRQTEREGGINREGGEREPGGLSEEKA